MTLNEQRLHEQPSAIAALTSAVGPSLAYHISECAHGGYIVIVDGAVYCACTHLYEAIAAMGVVASSRYGQAATPPERASVMPSHDLPVEDDPELDGTPRAFRPHAPRQPESFAGHVMSHVRRSAQAWLLVLVITGAVLWKGAA